MHSSESEKFGEGKECDIGVVLKIDGDDLIFKRAYNGRFNIYQGGAVTVNDLGEYDSKVIEFIESFIILNDKFIIMKYIDF